MIVQEFYEINGRAFVRTYSDANRYVVGGVPEGEYTEANDPVDANRTYTEGGPIDPKDTQASDPEDAQASDYIQALEDLGVRLS